jgi:GAF domain-containing protein
VFVSKEAMLELLRLLADGAEPEVVEEVQAPSKALSLAVAAARRMADHRVRERSLHALVDTARELGASTDPDTVLEAIVRRARALMGTDVAYITVYDPERGDTFVRATDGAVSPQFQILRVPLGIGLGGKVAETLQPWWTEEYAPDLRFKHSATIDSGVGEEGLVGICGTPLVVQGEFVGVLFAANRTRHTFTPHEVSLLGSLATLAALSIRQARSRVEIERALEEASTAHDAERRRTEDVIRSAEAHDRFTQLVAEGGGVDDITRLLAELLGGWAVVIDADGTRRSAAGAVPEPEVQLGQLAPPPSGTWSPRRAVPTGDWRTAQCSPWRCVAAPTCSPCSCAAQRSSPRSAGAPPSAPARSPRSSS